MKRIIATVLFIPIIFSSCNNGITKSGVSLNVNSLNTAFSLKVNETIYAGEMKADESNGLCLTFSSPEEVSGFVVRASENETVAEFDNVKLPPAKEDNAVSQLYRAVSALKTAENLSPVNDGYEYKNEAFSAVLDSQGKLKWLKVKQGEFYFK